MGKYLDIARRARLALAQKPSPSATEEPAPIIGFDEISKIVDNLDAKFLGIKPKNWLPNTGGKGKC
jgi:hypothetical protein